MLGWARLICSAHMLYSSGTIGYAGCLGGAHQPPFSCTPPLMWHCIDMAVRFVVPWQPADADRMFEHSLRHDPNSNDTHHAYGVFLAGSGRLERAEMHFRQAAELEPTNANHLFELAKLLHAVHRAHSTHACFDQL